MASIDKEFLAEKSIPLGSRNAKDCVNGVEREAYSDLEQSKLGSQMKRSIALVLIIWIPQRVGIILHYSFD